MHFLSSLLWDADSNAGSAVVEMSVPAHTSHTGKLSVSRGTTHLAQTATFHVELSDHRNRMGRAESAAPRGDELFERVNDQSAQKLGIEIGALRRHALRMLADGLNMLERGRHDQSCQREAGPVCISLFQSVRDFLD